jgi:hypothetical protein
MFELLVASRVCGGHSRSSSRNSALLASSFSTIASITRSDPATASPRSALARNRASAAAHSASLSLPLAMRPSRYSRHTPSALSSAAALLSLSATCNPRSAQCNAICWPIAPAPTTVTRSMKDSLSGRAQARAPKLPMPALRSFEA